MKKNKQLQKYAQQLRNNMTKAERRLWYDTLSMKKFDGYKFTRQKVIDHFIVDFYCHELKLIIEVDGKSHDYYDAVLLDKERESQLINKGFDVIRFSDFEVLHRPEMVFELLNHKIDEILVMRNDKLN